MESGNQERVGKVLQEYVRAHLDDSAAHEQLERFRLAEAYVSGGKEAIGSGVKASADTDSGIVALPLSPNLSRVGINGGASNTEEGPFPFEPKAQEVFDKALKLLGPNMTTLEANLAKKHLET